jgi:hypothetical protein
MQICINQTARTRKICKEAVKSPANHTSFQPCFHRLHRITSASTDPTTLRATKFAYDCSHAFTASLVPLSYSPIPRLPEKGLSPKAEAGGV